MITTQSTTKRFQTSVSNGRMSLAADPPKDKGGDGEGFGAHELLESALAACMNMAVRMRAVELGIAVPAVRTAVQISRPTPGTVTFNYDVALAGNLSASDREALMRAADECPVRQTLSKQLTFERSALTEKLSTDQS
jgi:putative redox protein